MSRTLFITKNINLVLVLYVCFVFIQSLFFKFTDSPETLHIFGTLDTWTADTFGLEGLFLPPGIFNAYVVGTTELIASAILLVGVFTALKFLIPIGALMSLGVITGAIFFHLFTPLDVDVGDGGALFAMACGVWLASAILIAKNRHTILNRL